MKRWLPVLCAALLVLLAVLAGRALAYTTVLKDPDATLDFGVRWGAWLAKNDPNDTISASAWTVPSGLTQVSTSYTTTTTTIWLAGGTAGTSYDVTNRIVTTGGRTDDRTIRINVQER